MINAGSNLVVLGGKGYQWFWKGRESSGAISGLVLLVD